MYPAHATWPHTIPSIDSPNTSPRTRDTIPLRLHSTIQPLTNRTACGKTLYISPSGPVAAGKQASQLFPPCNCRVVVLQKNNQSHFAHGYVSQNSDFVHPF